MSASMKEQVAVQIILQKKFSMLQSKNSRYSLRAFAKKLGIHVGALTYIINGKRNVSKKLAERIAVKLALDPQERAELLSQFAEKPKNVGRDKKVSENETRYLEFTAAQFRVLSEWEHFAIMSLARCKDFEGSFDWIAGRLGMSRTKCEKAIERLLQLEILEVNKNGQFVRTKKSYRTTDDIALISLKQHHEQGLDLAKESLFRDDVASRDFTSVTMAIDPQKIEKAKELIRKFQDDISDVLETGSQSEVYRLGIQLFPLSKLENRSGDLQ